MHRLRCTKHNSLVHDFFVSYRVSTDKINAEKLAALLDGKRKPDGTNFVTYLDKNCLVQGMDWEKGFTYGITHSRIILLLISHGVVTSMISKAKNGEVDNVLKEHQEALRLRDEAIAAAIVVPVCVASLTTRNHRDVYVKLDRTAILKEVDVEIENLNEVEACKRLEVVKQTLSAILSLDKIVDVEPESIHEKVSKILQVWYEVTYKPEKFFMKARKLALKFVKPTWFYSHFKDPSQSFQVTFVGSMIGFFGLFATLALLFMHSKSRAHTDLKLGVAVGNITAFSIIMVLGVIYCSQIFFDSNSLYCDSCEAVISDCNPYNVTHTNSTTYQYFRTIPKIDEYIQDCRVKCTESEGGSSSAFCLACICRQVYVVCHSNYATSMALVMAIAIMLVLAIGTGVIANKFMRTESFSMSLQ